jgi:Type I restriction modification DNA specificity domain
VTVAEGWTRFRLKYVVDCNQRVLPESTTGDLEFSYIDIGSVSQGTIDVASKPIKFADAPYRARRLADPGDTIISTVRTYLRAVAIVPELEKKLVFSTGFAVLHPRENVSPRFLAYALQGDDFVDTVVACSVGISYPAIAAKDLMALELSLPSLSEQRAIADFLDHETAQIDALVARQEEFVELLRERQRALLDAEFQTVGGKRRATIRQALERLIRTPRPGLGVVTAYRDGVVTLRANRRADGYTISEAEAGYQEVRFGDIVFHALDGFAGAVGISDSLGQCSPVYHVCRPRYDDNPRYLALLIRYLGTSGFLSTQAPSTRQRSVDFRNWGTFARVPLMLPPVEHQMAFVADFRRQVTSIDSLIAKAQEHIAFAKERRAALITAAVTGQFDVRTARKAG